MIWKFTIIHNTVETVIDEPVGWDSITKTLKRDPDTHGLTFNFSESNLEFSQDAYWIIKEEYLLKGVDGEVGLKIEWLCNDCDDYQFFYQGKLDFNRYNEVCGEDCHISIGLEASEIEVLITNRMDTAVDLTSNKAFDGTTVLTDYPYLNKPIDLPGKAILIETKAVNEKTVASGNLRNDNQWGIISAQNQSRGSIYPAFTKTVVTDIADTTFHDEIELLNGGANNRPSTGQIPIIDFKSFSTLPCVTSLAVIKYRFKGIINSVGGQPGATFKIFRLPAGKALDGFDYEQLTSHSLGNSGVPFDLNETLNVTLNVGDKIYCYIFINIFNPSDYSSYVLTEDPECFFDVSLHSICPPTPVKTYFIHETGSRIVENITNNQYKFKSEYYGRTDSQPFSFPADGCGSLRGITNGLQIRRAVLQDNTPPKVFLSLKDFIEGLNAIDCIGMGIEGNVVRAEPVKYFYSNDIIFIADGVNEITTTVRNEWIYNQFNFGYDKFETESTNGLDAMHTKRQYRLPIKNTDQKLEKVSKLIADGYAIEVTRRKYGVSEDWRYDQNPFIICCKRGNLSKFLVAYSSTGITFYTLFSVPDWAKVGQVLHIQAEETDSFSNVPIPANTGDYTIVSASLVGGYLFIQTSPGFTAFRLFAGAKIRSNLLTDVEVEQGNISSAANIFDPPTVINYAITPIRNAMRWFKWAIQGVRDYASSKMLFNSGEGNFVAKGLNTSTCVIEGAVKTENDSIESASFVDPDDAKPFTVPEKVSFKYPMGLNEFVDISVKKYGKVQYRKDVNGDWQYGWIDTLKYSPNDGEADFTLITAK